MTARHCSTGATVEPKRGLLAMTATAHPVRRGLAALLLPLSAVPVAAALPTVVDRYEALHQAHVERDALPAPDVALSEAERRAWQPLAPTRGRIPVLTYHGIADAADGYSVSRERFARQMAMLDRAGFRTISAERYARAIDGQDVALPERPVLITFDDARVNAYRSADRVLERHGFRATTFVETAEAAQRTPSYLRWDELEDMRSSGRWDVQLHSGTGHRRVRVNRTGLTGPFYANRAFRDGGLESRADAYRRITADLSAGARQLRDHLRGAGTWAFAVPYGTYGADGETNDPVLARRVGAWLKRRYAATFVQRTSDPRFSRTGDAHRAVDRYELRTDTSAQDVYDWLARSTTQRRNR